MDGEFNTACGGYYNLNKKLAAREVRFQTLLDNAPSYTRQTSLFELDRIISYNRKVHKVQADMEQIQAELRDVESLIFMMMRFFEIPPGTRLTGGIPEELEFEIWADEQDVLHCEKTKDLAPLVNNPNIITIKFNNGRGRPVEEEEE